MLTRSLLSALLVLGLASCGSSAKAPRPAGPGAALLASGQLTDAALADFLDRVARAAEAHDWPGLLALADADHRAAQMEQGGQDRATYLAELLGVHTIDNLLGDPITDAELATIARLEIVEVATDDSGQHAVSGWVVLTGGKRLRLSMLVTAGPTHALTGALG